MADTPDSGVVELIIAVDLDPKNPEEPLALKSLDAAPGGDGGEDWRKLTLELLGKSGLSYDEACEMVSKHLAGEVEPDEEEPDAFSMHREKRPDHEPPMHKAFGDRPDKPHGMKAAFGRAIGKKDTDGAGVFGERDEDDEEER